MWALTVPPVVLQCRLQKLEFFQWQPSVGRFQLSFSSSIPVWCGFNLVSPVTFQCGLFQLSFSNGVPVYPASILWVAQWYPSVHWINQRYSSGIPVYTWPASVHWLWVRGLFANALCNTLVQYPVALMRIEWTTGIFLFPTMLNIFTFGTKTSDACDYTLYQNCWTLTKHDY